MLLFTAPTKNWDWCLYETGLFTRFDLADPRSVVCLSAAGRARRARSRTCRVCRLTLRGLAPSWMRCAAGPGRFPTTGAAGRSRPRSRPIGWRPPLAPSSRGSADRGPSSTHYPCHRLVLSFSESDDLANGIPESARVVVGPSDTSKYTLSLFDLAGGGRHAKLGRFVGGRGRSRRRLAPRARLAFPPGRGRAAFPAGRRPNALRGREPGQNGSTVRSSTASCAGPRSDPRPGIPPSPTSGRAR